MADEENQDIMNTDKKSLSRSIRKWRKSCHCMTFVNVIVVIIVIITVVILALSGYEQKKGNGDNTLNPRRPALQYAPALIADTLGGYAGIRAC